MLRPAFLIPSLGLLALVACHAGATDEAAQSGAALEGSPGLVFRGVGEDADLTLSVVMTLGDQTVLRSYARTMQVVRHGVAFDVYCSSGVHVDAKSRSTQLSCMRYGQFHADSDSLRFTIVERDGSFTLENVKEQGAALTTQYATLVGSHGGSAFPLELTLSSLEQSQNPLRGAHDLADALTPLVGHEVYLPDSDSSKVAVAFDADIDQYMIARTTATLGDGSSKPQFELALVQKLYDAGTPWLSHDELLARAADTLPRPPLCDDRGHPIDTAETAASVALTALGGASYHLAREVDPAHVPPAVSAALADAAAEIRGRTVGDYADYEADVDGYYAIATSCSDPTPRFYGVHGSGAAYDNPHDEYPSYRDGTVIIVGLDGTRLIEDSEEDRD